jgi:hypothetical protein
LRELTKSDEMHPKYNTQPCGPAPEPESRLPVNKPARLRVNLLPNEESATLSQGRAFLSRLSMPRAKSTNPFASGSSS